MTSPSWSWPVVLVLSLLGASGCSAAPDEPPGQPAGEQVTTHTDVPTGTPSPATSATPTATPTPTPTPPHPVSLPALMEQQFDGRDLQVGDVIETTSAYTRYHVTYQSSGLTISGIMNVPAGEGPFPVLVLAHGYIDPDVYTNGHGLRREQDYLARQGYVVLHTDYRNHAQSDDDPGNEVRLRLGYTEDVVNAVMAVKGSSLPFLDGERVGLLGRSMGGGVTLNTLVVEPGLVDAAVIYASVSSNAVDNFDRWTRGQPEAAELTDQIVTAHGAPEDNPGFWRNVSPVTFFGRVTEPILIHHGDADESCPIEWAYETEAALREHSSNVTLEVYEGEPHAFEAGWQTSIERTAAFFEEHLSG